MQWDMTIPCSNCPFRKEGGIPLTKSKAKEIADMMLNSQGGTFPCHSTCDYSICKKGQPEPHVPETAKHCAGALIFAEKNGNATQMMRIVERFGGYDAQKLMSNKDIVAQIFDTRKQMVAAGGRRYAGAR